MLHSSCGKDFPFLFTQLTRMCGVEKAVIAVFMCVPTVYTEQCEVRSWMLDVKQPPHSFPLTSFANSDFIIVIIILLCI